MSAHEFQTDPIIAALRELRTQDVSPARAQRLRMQCHREFDRRKAETKRLAATPRGVWIRVTGALAGAWSVVYLVKTIRLAAAVFGF